MTNEAAERLRAQVSHLEDLGRQIVDEALAAERRATVERIRERYSREAWPIDRLTGRHSVLLTILDEEAK